MVSIRLWAIRIAGTVLFTILLFQSWHVARADWLGGSEHPGDLERAVLLEPDNLHYRLRHALSDMFAQNVPERRLEEEFREVLKLNPHNSEALMNLGLLAETRGAKEEAEHFLSEAAAADHTFKPVWTLANFFYRTNHPEKMLPEIRKALDLTTKPNLLFFDISHVYNLCWQTGMDSRQLLSLIPGRPYALLSYFFYLVQQKHLNAATEVYPRVIPLADASVEMHRNMFANYCDQLAQDGRAEQAVQVWNQMVEKHVVSSTSLAPNQAKSITNPSFALPFEPAPFGWVGKTQDAVAMTYSPGSLYFEFNGQQPDQEVLLQKKIPALPDRNYVLTWDADGSGIVKPSDPNESGLALRIYEGDKPVPVSCSTFLTQDKGRACRFHIPSLSSQKQIRIVNMQLYWARAAGSVRLKGAVLIRSFHLAFEDNAS